MGDRRWKRIGGLVLEAVLAGTLLGVLAGAAIIGLDLAH